MKRCCNQSCNQGRNCELRMPPQMGMSQAERDMLALVRRDRNAVLLAAAVLMLALVVISYLERVPS